LVWCNGHCVVRSLYVNGDIMTISEYEFFGANSYANAKDTRDTNSAGIPATREPEEETTTEERFIDMVKETEIKAATFCTLALLAGLCCALLLGCSTSAKVEGGAEIIELKPLKMQELTYPAYDYDKICADCGFTEWTDSWCEAHMGSTAFCSASK
jgi:hypothetical protein